MPIGMKLVIKEATTKKVERIIELGRISLWIQLGNKRFTCHSWDVAFIQMLYYMFGNAAVISCKHTDASSSNIAGFAAVNAGAGTNTYGIQVGTGSGAEDVTDYVLGTLIAHGNGAGQVQYAAVGMVEAGYVGTVVTGIVTRVLTGNAVGDVTVNEIGLTGTEGAKYDLLARDTTGGVVIPTTAARTCKYSVSTDEPFLQNFLACLFVVWGLGTPSYQIKDTSGTDVKSQISGNRLVMQNPASDAARGIVVGSNSGAFSVTDYKLGTQFLQGQGANQVLHGTSDVLLPVTISQSVYLTMTRVFWNMSSTGALSLEECGCYWYVTTSNKYICWLRTKTGTIAWPFNTGKIVEYTVYTVNH